MYIFPLMEPYGEAFYSSSLHPVSCPSKRHSALLLNRHFSVFYSSPRGLATKASSNRCPFHHREFVLDRNVFQISRREQDLSAPVTSPAVERHSTTTTRAACQTHKSTDTFFFFFLFHFLHIFTTLFTTLFLRTGETSVKHATVKNTADRRRAKPGQLLTAGTLVCPSFLSSVFEPRDLGGATVPPPARMTGWGGRSLRGPWGCQLLRKPNQKRPSSTSGVS